MATSVRARVGIVSSLGLQLLRRSPARVATASLTNSASGMLVAYITQPITGFTSTAVALIPTKVEKASAMFANRNALMVHLL